ncbi:hypothetical protein K470DRAFT_258144 [Piedraia hortae CBS 480.64]|uniref:Uncharacterized protein n=1 Tax=Piedraia hortae CBS 480.64 TaxID=1314780 RepID=A0A6A7BZS5_9PEZI|nr:hypothetical protein K470DRAFT_258144 [Piedraia hortae CBS 480.64]
MAATAFSALSIPCLPDDSMDLSSPGRQSDHDEIVLDFDEAENCNEAEGERMLTDSEPTQPMADVDDVMYDDDEPADETMMQEAMDEAANEATVEDEELIDFEDDPLTEALIQQGMALRTMTEAGMTLPEIEKRETTPPAPALESRLRTLTPEQHSSPPRTEVANISDHSDVRQEGHEIGITDSRAHSDEVQPSHKRGDGEGASREGEDVQKHHSDDQQRLWTDSETKQFSLPVCRTPDNPAETPGSPTDTGLHPMIICCGELTLPLFKSKHQINGLLTDDNLANLSLNELIRHCKKKLVRRIGSFSEEFDTNLAFGSLGLSVSETSSAAFQYSLHDVLEIYLKLHQNDDTGDAPCLSLTLAQDPFISHFAFLKQAVELGQGMSSLLPPDDSELDEQNNAEDHDAYYNDGVDSFGENPLRERAYEPDQDATLHEVWFEDSAKDEVEHAELQSEASQLEGVSTVGVKVLEGQSAVSHIEVAAVEPEAQAPPIADIRTAVFKADDTVNDNQAGGENAVISGEHDDESIIFLGDEPVTHISDGHGSRTNVEHHEEDDGLHVPQPGSTDMYTGVEEHLTTTNANRRTDDSAQPQVHDDAKAPEYPQGVEYADEHTHQDLPDEEVELYQSAIDVFDTPAEHTKIGSNETSGNDLLDFDGEEDVDEAQELQQKYAEDIIDFDDDEDEIPYPTTANVPAKTTQTKLDSPLGKRPFECSEEGDDNKHNSKKSRPS